MSDRRGFFITLEGPEGSGKSSQAARLGRALRRKGWPVVLVQDPGTTTLGQRLRRVLLHERHVLSPLIEALLFIAGRVQLTAQRIRPALAKGQVVVCDRFHDSTVVYQGCGGGLSVPWLDRLGREAIGGLMPDLTLVLDIPPAVGLRRVTGAKDRMERKALAFHRRVRRGFLTLARQHPRRVIVLDGTQLAPRLHQEIVKLVLRRLPDARR